MILPVIVAAVASWLFGAAWYGILSKSWMSAAGLTAADMQDASGKRKSPLVPMVFSFFCELLMAAVMKLILPMSATAGTGNPVSDVLVLAVAIWAGFMATTMAVNNSFAGRKPMLTVIDAFHWLGVMLVQASVLGLWT